MLPPMPSVQFHDYSTLGRPQTLGLWLFPIPVCALRFLPFFQYMAFIMISFTIVDLSSKKKFWTFKHIGEVIIGLPPLDEQRKHVNQVLK
jgi:hypothetical protein